MENIKVEQGHSPGEAATAGTRGQGASFDREDILVMQINEKEASWVTSVMSKDDKGLETYGKGGNAKLCQRAVIHNEQQGVCKRRLKASRVLCNHAPVMREGIEHSNVHGLTCLLRLRSPGFCGPGDTVNPAKETFIYLFLIFIGV